MQSDILWFEHDFMPWYSENFMTFIKFCKVFFNFPFILMHFWVELNKFFTTKLQQNSIARKKERGLISSKWNMNKRACISSYTHEMTLKWLKFNVDLSVVIRKTSVTTTATMQIIIMLVPFCLAMGSMSLWHIFELNGFRRWMMILSNQLFCECVFKHNLK